LLEFAEEVRLKFTNAQVITAKALRLTINVETTPVCNILLEVPILNIIQGKHYGVTQRVIGYTLLKTCIQTTNFAH
jgi:hypothetical protein